MPNWSPTPVRPDGEFLTGANYQADRQQAANADVPQVQDDYSATVAQMQTVADPAPAGTPSLATSLAGELERLRFTLLKIKQSLRGTVAQWYEPFTIDPATLPTGPTGPAGPQGPAGTNGAAGPPGPGVAAGGTTGQVLAKNSATNYDTGWIDPPAGGGGGEGADEVHIGPAEPVDPAIELWVDSDEPAPAGGGGGAVLASTCEGRLTTESGVPVSTTDRTAQSTLYFTPYRGNQVALYSGTAWAYATLTERSLALSGLTSGKPYDVFLYDNAGTLTLELVVWTNDTTRATALAVQDGIYVKTGAPTRRYVGTIYTTGTTTTEDSAARRYVWNMQHRVRRVLRNATETTASWAYTSTTVRQARASAANQLDYVVGLAEVPVDAEACGLCSVTVNVVCAVGIGVESTTANSAQTYQGLQVASGQVAGPRALYRGTPGLGRHVLTWLEWIHSVSGAVTWYGTMTFTVPVGQAGIVGAIEG